MPPSRRAVTVGNEAPVPGPASQVAGGSVSPATPAWPYAHQRYDDVIGNSPSDQHHHARLGLVTPFLPAPQLATSGGARSYRMRASQPRARLSQICVPAYQPSSRSGFLKVRGIKACYASLVRSGTRGMAALALPVRGTRFRVPAFPQVRPPFRGWYAIWLSKGPYDCPHSGSHASSAAASSTSRMKIRCRVCRPAVRRGIRYGGLWLSLMTSASISSQPGSTASSS